MPSTYYAYQVLINAYIIECVLELNMKAMDGIYVAPKALNNT